MTVSALALAIGASCVDQSAGTAEGNCRRYLKALDDVNSGKISGSEFIDRLRQDIGEFKSGTDLRKSYDSLVSYIETRADPRLIEAESGRLGELCSNVLDRGGDTPP